MDARRVLAAALGVALSAAPALAQRAPAFAPAEPVPADHAGSDWRDSRGCLFVRGMSAGAVVWLPVMDAERRPVCDLAVAAPAAPDATLAAPQAPAPPEVMPPATDVAEAAADSAVPHEVSRAGAALARAARSVSELTGAAVEAAPAAVAAIPQGGPQEVAEVAEVPAPEVPPPPAAPEGVAIAPLPAAPVDAFEALDRLRAEAEAPAGRLIFLDPDARVRIVQVTLPSVLVGNGDPFGVNEPLRSAAAHPPVRRGTLVGYYPQPMRLSVAPPIRGFGPDPAPVRWRAGH